MKIKLSHRAKKIVDLTGDALLRAGASNVLAIDEAVAGKSLALLADAPAPEEPANQIGVVRIEGPLAQRALLDEMCAYVDGYDAITERLGAVLAAPEVAGAVLVIDSPGGDVAGLSEGVRRMREMVEQSGKPVVAFVDELAASAAYWIAAGVADEIHVPEGGRVGSIGCIGAWVDPSKAFERAGIVWHVHRDPAGKAEMMPAAPLAKLADERAIERVKTNSARFIAAMAARRGVDEAAIRGLNAAVLEARAAVDAKLADVVGTLEGAADRALSMAQKRQKDRSMKNIALLVGLAVTATAAEVEARLETIAADICTAAGVKSLDQVAASIEATKTKADAHKTKADDFDVLTAKLEADAKTQKAARLQATLDSGVKAGKIPPTKRADLETKAQKFGVEWLENLVDELPAKVRAIDELDAKTTAETEIAVSEELAALLKRGGMTEDDYRAAVKAGAI